MVIYAISCYEVFVCSRLNDDAILEYSYIVCCVDGRKTVRSYDSCSPLSQLNINTVT